MKHVVKLRGSAESEAALEALVSLWRTLHGANLQNISRPYKNRSGTGWRVYADVVVEVLVSQSKD